MHPYFKIPWCSTDPVGCDRRRKETGVTTMMMDVGLDTGDILETKVIPLDPKETSGSLFEKLSEAGGPLILSTLEKLEKELLQELLRASQAPAMQRCLQRL